MRPFARSLPMALLQARESAMRQFRPMLAEHDLTEQQWRVLRSLAATDKPMTIGEVAEHTFLLGPSLSRIIANLEERNLITRTVAATDHRRSNLSLAQAGHTLVGKVAPHSEATYTNIENTFGKKRLTLLLKELHDLTESLVKTSQSGT